MGAALLADILLRKLDTVLVFYFIAFDVCYRWVVNANFFRPFFRHCFYLFYNMLCSMCLG